MNRYIKNLNTAINNFIIFFLFAFQEFGQSFLNIQNQLIQSIHTAKQKYFNKISKNCVTH